MNATLRALGVAVLLIAMIGGIVFALKPAIGYGAVSTTAPYLLIDDLIRVHRWTLITATFPEERLCLTAPLPDLRMGFGVVGPAGSC
jgi:hypothetical protein